MSPMHGLHAAWLLVVMASLCTCVRYGYDRGDGPASTCGNGFVDEWELCDIAIRIRKGACPSECPKLDSCTPMLRVGRGCDTQCRPVPITGAVDGDGCCPAGRSGIEDSDCVVCGDGVIDMGETCDPPESCPDVGSCVADNVCIEASLQGDPETCDARCFFAPVATCSSDGCCPASCNTDTDEDCSAACGDGQVDPSSGETCEPDVDAMICAANCEDNDPCTVDVSVGSADNCNLECVRTPITDAVNDDSCCLPGSNARLDTDCAPQCGNGVVEAGEPCDGGTLCSADCRRLLPESLLHRYRFVVEDNLPTIAFDSVGEADGNIMGTSLDGSGDLALAGGTSNQYVDLPNGLISTLPPNATFEAWVTWSNALRVDHERIFDFGTSGLGEDKQGGSRSKPFFYLTPSLVADATPRVAFSSDGETQDGITGRVGSFPVGIMTHVAVVFSDIGNFMSLYINGALVGSITQYNSLSILDDNNNWLGHSQFFSDAEFGGLFHEFRIYGAALSADEIAVSFELGPDADAGL
jgi:hypothetical protein